MQTMTQVRYVPTLREADQWEAFALLAEKIGSGQSTDYAQLNDMGAALSSATVFGALSGENPCIRLRRVANKAAYSMRPQEFHLSMRECARAILSAYNRDFGGVA